MGRPEAPRMLPSSDALADAQRDLRLMADVVRALMVRVGGEAVVTADDLFVAQRCDLRAAPLLGGGLALQIVMPAVIPPGPAEFRP